MVTIEPATLDEEKGKVKGMRGRKWFEGALSSKLGSGTVRTFQRVRFIG